METRECGYKSDAKGEKQGYLWFIDTPAFYEATKQAAVADRACGCHIGTTNKDATSSREIGYHNL